MLSFFKKIFAPKKATVQQVIEVSSLQEIDLRPTLLECLAAKGIEANLSEEGIQLTNGLHIRPIFTDLRHNDNGTVGTSTVIWIKHASEIPNEIFEFQHSTCGDSVANALNQGFEFWIDMDLPVLSEALQEVPSLCMRMDISDSNAQLYRRVMLGPIQYYGMSYIQESNEHPSFCKCCLFTKNMETFMPLIQSSDFYAVRLFVARSENNEFSADCRINGEDWDAGKQALLTLAQTWKGSGLTFQKQYIVIQQNRFYQVDSLK
jgi:hypothetical protein